MSDPRSVRTLVTLGDSTGVGIGDPLPDGGWRGVGPLLATALGSPRHVNLSFTGARLRCVRLRQLPTALDLRPDIALVLAGMNDTLRSAFSPRELHLDLDAAVGSLTGVGCSVFALRFHDHSRVFRLPGPLRRALCGRIAELNNVVDAVVTRHGARSLDLDGLPGVYDRAAWSVDRLHPSELGYRMLASGFAAAAADAGWRVPVPVSMCHGGGRPTTRIEHLGWLLRAGLPWLCRRGRDLLPHALSLAARDVLGRATAQPPALPTTEFS